MTNRTSLPVTSLSINGSNVSFLNDGTTFTATDNTNGMSVAIPTTSIPASGNADRLVLLVLNTNGTGRTVTIRRGTKDGGATKTGAGTADSTFYAPFFEASHGDLTTSAMTATTGIGIIGPLETARFIQPDDTISIDFSGATGYIAALLLPRAY